jgi:hypothetical protein
VSEEEAHMRETYKDDFTSCIKDPRNCATTFTCNDSPEQQQPASFSGNPIETSMFSCFVVCIQACTR